MVVQIFWVGIFFFLTWKNFVGKFFIEWDFFVGMGFFFLSMGFCFVAGMEFLVMENFWKK